jgi:tetratricopeptide (TPR) repeat protein
MGHASLGSPHDAVRHAQRATEHLGRAHANNRELAAAFNTLAACHQQLGHLDAAADAWCQSIAALDLAAADSTEWALTLMRLGDLRRVQGHFADAEEILTRALAAVVSDHHIDDTTARAHVLNAIGIVYKDTGRYDAAAGAYTEALELLAAIHGPDDSATASLWHNLAGLAHARDHPHDAVSLAAKAVRLRERHLGPEHYLVAEDLAVLGAALLDANRVNDAEPLFHRALTIFEARHPAHRYDVAVNLANLAACKLARGDTHRAEELIRQGLAVREPILGPDHPEIARQLKNLAVIATHNPRPPNTTRRPGPPTVAAHTTTTSRHGPAVQLKNRTTVPTCRIAEV